MMKAIVYHNNGSADVLKLQEIEKPVPRDDEVLISSGQHCDVIFDLVANHSFSERRRLTPDLRVYIGTLRKPEVRQFYGETKPEGLDRHRRAYRGRKGKASDRQALQLE